MLSLAPTRCSVALSKVLLPSLTHWNASPPGINQTASLGGQKASWPPSKRLRKHSQQNHLHSKAWRSTLDCNRRLREDARPWCYPICPSWLLLAGFFNAKIRKHPLKSKLYLFLQPLNTSFPTSFSQVSRPAFSPTASPVCNLSKSSATFGSPHSSPLPADTKPHFAT